MDKAKSIFLSKTFWVNLVAVLAMFWPGIGEMMSEESIVMILGSLNIVLRMFTKEPVKVMPEKE